MFRISIKRRCDGVPIEMDVKVNEVQIDLDDYYDYYEMKYWCEINVKGNWVSTMPAKQGSRLMSQFIFVDEEDAVAFKLRWM